MKSTSKLNLTNMSGMNNFESEEDTERGKQQGGLIISTQLPDVKLEEFKVCYKNTP